MNNRHFKIIPCNPKSKCSHRTGSGKSASVYSGDFSRHMRVHFFASQKLLKNPPDSLERTCLFSGLMKDVQNHNVKLIPDKMEVLLISQKAHSRTGLQVVQDEVVFPSKFHVHCWGIILNSNLR